MKVLVKLYCLVESLKYARDERGVTALEYALIAAAIVVAVGTAMAILVPGLNSKLASICTQFGVTCGSAPSGGSGGGT